MTVVEGRPVAAARRRELGSFLRSRRERLSCADVGLPLTGRRRTPGLRREELAVLAGISATWLTYLEQGRDVRPSRQVLDALGTALQLTPAEHRHVVDLTAPPPEPSAHEVPAAVVGVVGALDPDPAYVLTSTFDVLAWNPSAAGVFPQLVGGPAPNLARWVFTDPVARQVLVQWDAVAQDLLARLRATVAQRPEDPRRDALVADLRATSAQARQWWSRHDVRASRSGTKRLRLPGRGVLDVPHASFAVAGQADLTLVVHLLSQAE